MAEAIPKVDEVNPEVDEKKKVVRPDVADPAGWPSGQHERRGASPPREEC